MDTVASKEWSGEADPHGGWTRQRTTLLVSTVCTILMTSSSFISTALPRTSPLREWKRAGQSRLGERLLLSFLLRKTIDSAMESLETEGSWSHTGETKSTIPYVLEDDDDDDYSLAIDVTGDGRYAQDFRLWLQQRASRVVTFVWFKRVIYALIVVCLVLLGVGGEDFVVVKILRGVFTVELVVRVVAQRVWFNGWNSWDAVVIAASWLVSPLYLSLRAVRLLRAVRKARVVGPLVRALIDSLPALWSVAGLWFVALYVCGVIAAQGEPLDFVGLLVGGEGDLIRRALYPIFGSLVVAVLVEALQRQRERWLWKQPSSERKLAVSQQN